MIIPSNLPPEFHASGKPSEVMRKILCKYYGVEYIPVFVSSYARKANDAKITQALYEEIRTKHIPKTTLLRQIVWKHFGYASPMPTQKKVECKVKKVEMLETYPKLPMFGPDRIVAAIRDSIMVKNKRRQEIVALWV